jgi:hypothetical protein
MLCANGVDHPHHIQAMQQHVELQVELTDHIRGSDMALWNQIQLNGAQYKCHRYVLLCSHLSMRY